MVGGEARPHGHASSTLGPEVGFNLVSGVLASSLSFFQESSSKAAVGFYGIFSSREQPILASSPLIVHAFYSKIKRLKEILSEVVSIYSRESK